MRRLPIWPVLPLGILLVAVFLRTWQLTAIPPGLTHDEANHGREAIEVLTGQLQFYFPYNYGSEPLYSYVVAGLMGLVGRHLLALRLVNVYAGLLTIAATFTLGRQLFDRPVALIAAASMAVTFWPVASSREALRAGLLPLITVLTAAAFWHLFFRHRSDSTAERWVLALLVGVGIAAGFHNYLAARVWWLLFPSFWVYLLIWRRPAWRGGYSAALGGMMLAALMVTPMFIFLRLFPEMQPRLQMLDGTLQSVRDGQLQPLMDNALRALGAFVVPGYGDQFLAYNIPGRPVFDWVTGAILLLGVGVSLWRWRQPQFAFVLLWFVFGITPSLVTGPTANTTRNLAALPALYLLVGIGGGTMVSALSRRLGPRIRVAVVSLALVWLGIVALTTATDYFVRWGESPDVRAAYQSTIIAAVDTVDWDQPSIISTLYPGPAHDVSIALVATGRAALPARWTDVRYALLFPEGRAALLTAPSSTPPHPLFAGWLTAPETVTLRPTDLDPTFTTYHAAEPAGWVAVEQAINFNDAILLTGHRWLANPVLPGDVVQLVTRWRVLDPGRVGPLVLPAYTTDVVLFTHILQPDGTILTQRDALDAPSWSWRGGDVLVQIHQIALPPNLEPGSYATVVGWYDRASGERLPVLDGAHRPVETLAPVTPLVVE